MWECWGVCALVGASFMFLWRAAGSKHGEMQPSSTRLFSCLFETQAWWLDNLRFRRWAVHWFVEFSAQDLVRSIQTQQMQPGSPEVKTKKFPPVVEDQRTSPNVEIQQGAPCLMITLAHRNKQADRTRFESISFHLKTALRSASGELCVHIKT